MPSDLKFIISAISQPLKTAGFRHRDKRNWYYDSGEVLQNIHLEKSSYSNKNWLDCYLSIKGMDGPNEPRFGVILAIEPLLREKDLLDQALNQDDFAMSADDRSAIVRASLERDILPTLRLLSSEKAVVEFYRQKKSRREFAWT